MIAFSPLFIGEDFSTFDFPLELLPRISFSPLFIGEDFSTVVALRRVVICALAFSPLFIGEDFSTRSHAAG